MELEPNQRVVAIWDIHGNLSLLKYCLKAANLIEGDSDDWVGGNTILVQLGDLLDRGAFEVEVLKLLAKLGDQAKAAGGVVAVIWGNHEIFNACGDFTCSYIIKEQRDGQTSLMPHWKSDSALNGQVQRSFNARRAVNRSRMKIQLDGLHFGLEVFLPSPF